VPKQRLDQAMVARGLVATRSQAESYIKLGEVLVDDAVVTKTGRFVFDDTKIRLTAAEQYVSRAALKLASVTAELGINFQGKIVLDVGSSTGGFTDYALRSGAIKVIAVEVGTDQMHPNLRGNPNIELHEQTDIRDLGQLSVVPGVVVIDVSFISLREILPTVCRLSSRKTEIIAMVKPQFEASASNLKHKGVIKNDRIRRAIFKDFEAWVSRICIIEDKADSHISGAKGNQERFYKLRKI
jgi:23S rRNA (cytidine1920-2'-O)/16S rRNA (cytidine1409-2'-O)-methyltransferase